MTRISTFSSLACALLLLSACESMPGQGNSAKPADAKPAHLPAAATQAKPSQQAASPPPAPALPPPVPADQLALKEGLALYNNGEYNKAIARLSAPEIGGGSMATQVSALKHLAFSYCVTGRRTLCRQQFEKAFKLDPAFDLGPGENGHPLWGPAFKKEKDKAKKAK